MKKMVAVFLTVLLCAVMLMGSAGVAEDVVFRIGTFSEVANRAAWLLRSGQDKAEWVWTVYEPLFDINEAGEIVPYLAESLETDADAMTYTVKVREGVTFSDGSVLNADVLLWNFENFKANSTMSSTHFGNVESFEKIDDRTVVIHMAEWSSQIPYSLCSVAGLMYSKAAFDANGADWVAVNPVGTGAYVLTEDVKDDYKTFTLREDYWNTQKQPVITKIIYKVVPDEMTAQAAMMNQELDAFLEGSYTFCEDVEMLGYPRVTTAGWYFGNFLVFASGVEGSPMADVRVRQAIAYAINSEEICQVLDRGMTFENHGYAAEGTAFHNDEIIGYNFDPEKAKALLAEAGYADGFKTKLYTGTDLANRPLMVAIQGYLADVGIEAELIFQDVSIWSSQTIYGIDEGMILCAHGFGTNIVNRGVSNFSKKAISGVGMLKDSAIHPDDVDENLMNALTAKDNDSMMAYFKAADKLITDTYCMAYAVDMDAYSWTSVSDRFVDNGCFGTQTEYYDYARITLK